MLIIWQQICYCQPTTIQKTYKFFHSSKYVKLYSGAEPVFDEEDIFKLTIPPDDDYSPEAGKTTEKILRLLNRNNNCIFSPYP